MKKIALLFFALLLFSCGEKVVEKPENLIPRDKMVNILHDLALLKASKSSYKNMMDEAGIETMIFLYERYQIDSAQFSQSDLYYASIPLEYQAIYEEVEAALEKRKKQLKDVEKKRNDSIKNAQKINLDSIKNVGSSTIKE